MTFGNGFGSKKFSCHETGSFLKKNKNGLNLFPQTKNKLVWQFVNPRSATDTQAVVLLAREVAKIVAQILDLC
jgi:hypothetical protein